MTTNNQPALQLPDRITARICRCAALITGSNACPHCGAGWAEAQSPLTEYARVRDGGVATVDDEQPAYDGSMTPEQLERAALVAKSREIDLETAQELVYLRDRAAVVPQSFEEAQLQKLYEDPHPGYDCRETCVIHSGRFATTAPVAAGVERDNERDDDDDV